MSERESRPGESGPFVSTVQPSDEELVDGLANRRMEGWTTRPLTRTGGPLDAVPVTGGMSGGLYGTLLSEDIIPTGGGPRVDKIHGVLTDDPQLVSAVVKAIDGDDGAAVMIIAEKFRLSGVEAGEVLAAVLGEGKRPDGFHLDYDSAGRLRLRRNRSSGPEPIRSTPSLIGLTLTMPSATHPSGVRSLSLEEIDEVFSALDEERRQTGEDLEDRAETLAWMRREVARLDTFESTFLAVNELCPPSDWLRDLKAASHDPDALVDLLRRATAARAEKDVAGAEVVADRHNCHTCAHGGRFACNLYGSMRSEALTWRRSNTTGDGCPGWEGKAKGEGFQTPSAPAQPSPALFDADQPDWLPEGWTHRLGVYVGPGGMRVFTDGGGRAVAWGSTHPDIEAWTEWNEQDKRALVMALADPWRVTGPGGEAADGTTKPPTFKGMAKLRDDGFLQELNRLVLHPAGLALALTQEDDGRVVDVTVMETEDPEGWAFCFTRMTSAERLEAANQSAKVSNAISARARTRRADPDLGSVIEAPPVAGAGTWEYVTGMAAATLLTAAQSFILADTCLDATPYEKGAHDAATAILRGDLSTGDPRVTLRGQVEEARQTAHALESMLVQVKAERDRALAVLAAETGKQGLPGWTWDEREREWSIYYRERAVRLTAWGATVSGGPAFHARIGIKALSTGSNVAATDALNAMEKATAWARVRGYTGEAPDLEAIVPVQARTEIAHLWEHGADDAAVEVYRSCFLEPMTYNEACNALDLYFESKPKAEPATPGPV